MCLLTPPDKARRACLALTLRQQGQHDSCTRWVQKSVLVHVSGTPLAPGMYKPLSEPAEVWHFDLRSPPEDSAERTLDLSLTRPGVLNAIVFWFKLHLIDGIELSTGPEAVSAGMPPPTSTSVKF